MSNSSYISSVLLPSHHSTRKVCDSYSSNSSRRIIPGIIECQEYARITKSPTFTDSLALTDHLVSYGPRCNIKSPGFIRQYLNLECSLPNSVPLHNSDSLDRSQCRSCRKPFRALLYRQKPFHSSLCWLLLGILLAGPKLTYRKYISFFQFSIWCVRCIANHFQILNIGLLLNMSPIIHQGPATIFSSSSAGFLLASI